MFFRRMILVLALLLVAPLINGTERHATPKGDKGAWMYEPCGKAVPDAQQCIEKLLKAYPGDGANWLEIGPQLCKAVVAHPAAFFRAARNSQQGYASWLHDLPENTFSVLVPEGSVECELQTAYLDKLKELMVLSLQDFIRANGNDAKQAEHLLRVLNRTAITSL